VVCGPLEHLQPSFHKFEPLLLLGEQLACDTDGVDSHDGQRQREDELPDGHETKRPVIAAFLHADNGPGHADTGRYTRRDEIPALALESSPGYHRGTSKREGENGEVCEHV